MFKLEDGSGLLGAHAGSRFKSRFALLCHVSRFGQHDEHVDQSHFHDDDVFLKNEAKCTMN